MLKSLRIKNLTVFPEANLRFSKHINVIVGENSSGKTHLLKIAYSALFMSWNEGRNALSDAPTKSLMQTRLAEKLVNVFRPESLGKLVRRRQRERCDIQLHFQDDQFDFAFSFASNSKIEVLVEHVPESWFEIPAVYLPTRELLTIFPNFISVYEGHYLEFEETWRDTCLLLGAPLQRGRREGIQRLLRPLETAMGGSIELDKNGRFYLKDEGGRLEMPLVAEGQRKLAMLARLIATGTLVNQGVLFWDEPEANLNPRLIKHVARSILELSNAGIQVFLATHSLFLLRELEILISNHRNVELQPRFFGLHFSNDLPSEHVVVQQGDAIDEIGNIAALDENLAQSDRFLDGGD